MRLKDSQDAFGRGMYAYLHGEEVDEVIEREDGYIDVSEGPRSYLSPYEEWPAHLQRAMHHAKGRVLDIGCGGGRHSLYLQGKGLDVLGIDISPMALECARERGLRNTRLMDISEVTGKLGTFDTIMMLGNNFGLFGSRKKARWLLRRFKAATSPDAVIIAETLDIYQTDKKHHLDYQAWNRRRGRMSGQVRIRARYLNYCTPWFDYLMVSKPELEELLLGTGWKVKKYLDGRKGVYIMILEKEVSR
jgi:2-polyprenyl-3-methyl-5-hydroxy-6-metoxy-1,4-benzoquinol methylase